MMVNSASSEERFGGINFDEQVGRMIQIGFNTIYDESANSFYQRLRFLREPFARYQNACVILPGVLRQPNAACVLYSKISLELKLTHGTSWVDDFLEPAQPYLVVKVSRQKSVDKGQPATINEAFCLSSHRLFNRQHTCIMALGSKLGTCFMCSYRGHKGWLVGLHNSKITDQEVVFPSFERVIV